MTTHMLRVVVGGWMMVWKSCCSEHPWLTHLRNSHGNSHVGCCDVVIGQWIMVWTSNCSQHPLLFT